MRSLQGFKAKKDSSEANVQSFIWKQVTRILTWRPVSIAGIEEGVRALAVVSEALDEQGPRVDRVDLKPVFMILAQAIFRSKFNWAFVEKKPC